MEGEPSLRMTIETARIAGSRERGDRPHIQFQRARYTSQDLARRINMLGKVVEIRYDANDIESIEVFTSDGVFIGHFGSSGRGQLAAAIWRSVDGA